MTIRQSPSARREMILTAALMLAATCGASGLSRESVAASADCSPSLISHYFTTMTQLRRAVMRAAIHSRNLPVIARGIAERNRYALAAPAELKAAAISTLL